MPGGGPVWGMIMTGIGRGVACAAWLLAASAMGGSVPAGAASDQAVAKNADAGAKDGPVPVEAFAALPAIDEPKLSPDGTRVAGKMAIDGTQYLMITPVTGGADTKPSVVKVGPTVDINWWRWVSDGWLAVGLGSQDMVYGTEVYVTRVIGLSADAKVMKRLDWEKSGIRADDVLWTARDGSPRILLAKQTGITSEMDFWPSVYEYDLSTGRGRRIVNGVANVWDWYADGAGQVRIGYRLDDSSRKATLLYRANNGETFRTIARADRKNNESFVTPVLFRADGSAIGIDDSDGHDTAYEMSLPDLKLGKTLFATPGYDIASVIPNPAGDDVAGYGVDDHYYHSEWTDPAMHEVQAAMDKAVGNGRHAHILSWSADRTKLLVSVGSASQAGIIYYFDTGSGRMQRLSWANPKLQGRILSPVRTIRYPARDGTIIEAVLTLPRARTAKALPIIILPHGGPFARDDESWDWWTQYLAELGYAVIQPNYRGSSGYGREFAKKGEGQWGLKMQDDLDDALAWAVKEGIADPKRACMVGASYGGYAAMRAAQRGGGLYRCAISYAGVSDLAAMRAYDGQFLYGRTRGDWLKKQAPDFRSVSPRFGAAAFSVPILLVHGKADKRVPVKQSRMMAGALEDAGKPFEYFEQPLADHHFTRSEDRLTFLQRMKAFLDRHNPA